MTSYAQYYNAQIGETQYRDLESIWPKQNHVHVVQDTPVGQGFKHHARTTCAHVSLSLILKSGNSCTTLSISCLEVVSVKFLELNLSTYGSVANPASSWSHKSLDSPSTFSRLKCQTCGNDRHIHCIAAHIVKSILLQNVEEALGRTERKVESIGFCASESQP